MEGVYIIKNNINGRFYIGSSKRLKYRLRQHLSNLRGGYSENENIQKDWSFFGESSFDLEVIEFCQNYKEREQYYIDTMNPDYNVFKNSKSPEGSQWSRSHKRRKFIQVYTNDKFIGVYLGPKEVSEKLGLIYSSVNAVLNGKRTSLKGYKIENII
jgi:group I intron endonuclease